MANWKAWFAAQEEKKKAEEALKKQQEEVVVVKEDKPVTLTTGDNDSGYYNFHINSNAENNKHYFLSEELLVPRACNSDTQRLNMFANHINQFVHLKNPEFPKVFTNFENQVGEYSVAYKKAEDTFDVIAKIEKNMYNFDLVVRYKSTGVYDIIHYNKCRNITEDYGYALNNCLEDVKVGDTVLKDSWLFRSDNYDDDGNFAYGVNLKSVYMSWNNMTYEDGVVLSESAAEKLKSYKVEKTMLSINGNDVLLNLYGDDETYKSFPKVGDYVDSKVLVASRRRDKRTTLYDFQANKMQEIDPVDDEVIYTGGGTVVDITVFNNISLAELRKKTDIFNKEILDVVENQYRYWYEMAAALEKIIPCKVLTEAEEKAERSEFGHCVKHPIDREKNSNKYTDELAYYWKLAHENIDEQVKWRYDGKVFDNFKIQFTILKENPLTEGCKISGRYGNKGIVAQIVENSKMPLCENGVRAEACLNPLGVLNRLNLSQIQEQFLNFVADHVVADMKKETDINAKSKLFFEFISLVNKEQFDFLEIEYLSMNRNEKAKFIEDIETKGIFIHQPPFYGATTEEQFRELYIKHPEWCKAYKFEDIERPMTMGDLYFIRLKHESSNKMSMRSATNLNVKNLPAKSTLKKEKKILYSTNPLRMGEMEITNLMLTKKPNLVEKFMKTYSTNEEFREETVSQLLYPGRDEQGNMRNALDMNLNIDLESGRAISRELLDKYFNVLGYNLTDNLED